MDMSKKIKTVQLNSPKINSLPNDKILDLSKYKAYADDTINMNQKLKLDFRRVENIVGKGENDGYQHYLHFPQCFLKGFFFRAVKTRGC